MNKTLSIAITKSKHKSKRNYTGCLTPSEIVAMSEIATFDKQILRDAKTSNKNGLSNPQWVTFTVKDKHIPLFLG